MIATVLPQYAKRCNIAFLSSELRELLADNVSLGRRGGGGEVRRSVVVSAAVVGINVRRYRLTTALLSGSRVFNVFYNVLRSLHRRRRRSSSLCANACVVRRTAHFRHSLAGKIAE